jgi:hypothetical protein
VTEIKNKLKLAKDIKDKHANKFDEDHDELG